jgi:hypothetical protein
MHIELWKIAIVAGLVILSFIVYRRTFPPVSPAKRALLLGLRIAAFLLLGLLLVNPVFVSTSIEAKKPVILALLDDSRSMGTQDVAGKTRIEAALDALGGFRRALGRGSGIDVETLPFAGALAAAPAPSDSAITADGEGTDVWGALEDAQRMYRSSNVAAIVLLTDGRITRGMMTSGEDIMVPVYAVGFGDTLEAADIAVDEVIYDRIAYQGTAVPIEVVVHATGFRGKTLQLQLRDGGRLKASASLVPRKDSEYLSASLSFAPDRQGEHALTIEVPPVAGERHQENNVEQFRIDVLKDKIRILYLDQFPDWNMTFVHNFVQRSKRLSVDEVTWIPKTGFTVNGGSSSWVFPSSPGALEQYDLMIVSDDAKLFDAKQHVDVLEGYVAGGGSILFLADENSPLARSGAFDLVRSLASVQMTGRPRLEYRECSVRPSTESVDDPVALMLTENGDLDALPPLSGRIADIAPTAGARVPLVLDDGERRYPFIAIGRTGEGLSSVIFGFPLWRWKLAGEKGERIYESFFGGLVQYLAEGAKAPGLAVNANRTVYRTGDRIALTAFVGERRLPDGVRGEVRRKGPGGGLPVSTFMFEADPNRSGYFLSELEPLAPGEYVVTATEVSTPAGGLTGGASFSVVPVSVEFLKTSRDASLLAEVAHATNGAYLEGAELPLLASRLSFKEQRVERREAHELRGSIAIFLGAVALLAAEWIFRKTWGLV